jgi:hypothetical protein
MSGIVARFIVTAIHPADTGTRWRDDGVFVQCTIFLLPRYFFL